MKTFVETLDVTFSMYSRIPMPQVESNNKNMRFALACFPLVGAVVAAVLWGIFRLTQLAALSPLFFAAAAVAIPVLVTGGIHLDGYCDTCDALAAHGNLEKRLQILKDPHVGAFGAVYTGVLLLLQLGAWQQIFLKPHFLLAALSGFVLSRAFAALAVLHIPKREGSGLAAAFADPAAKGPSTAILLIFVIAATAVSILDGWPGLAVPVAALLVFLCMRRMSVRQFGGMSGDLAGFSVSVCEVLSLLLAAILGALL